MARLTTTERDALPDSEFAIPDKREFPIEDKAHQIAAERLLGRAVKHGSVTTAEAKMVKRKARARLGKRADMTMPGQEMQDADDMPATGNNLGKYLHPRKNRDTQRLVGVSSMKMPGGR